MIAEHDVNDLLRASLYFHELFKKTVLANAPSDLVTKTQMDLLMTLYTDGPMNMTQLSEHVGIAPEQATRAITSLRDKGLVHKERSETNRRMVIVTLSEQGVVLLDDYTHTIKMHLEAAFQNLDTEEVSKLASIARDATKILEKTGFRQAM